MHMPFAQNLRDRSSKLLPALRIKATDDIVETITAKAKGATNMG